MEIALMRNDHRPAVRRAIQVWANARTDPESGRRRDLVRDKTRIVTEFFEFTGKHPGQVTPLDVATWIAHLQDQELAAATVYNRLSQVSSWYTWAISDDRLRQEVKTNPVNLSRPKPPPAYHNSQALGPEALKCLLAVVPRDTLTGLRDYALLLWFLLTAHRRAEVCRLRWEDLTWEGERLVVKFLVKGGDFKSEVVSPLCWQATKAYLEAAGRLHSMEPDTPLWIGHDGAGQANGPLSSHAVAGNLKRYAKRAGIQGRVHLHMLRHSVARILAEGNGSLSFVQEVLGHRSLSTTRIYCQRITVRPDRHSQLIIEALGLE